MTTPNNMKGSILKTGKTYTLFTSQASCLGRVFQDIPPTRTNLKGKSGYKAAVEYCTKNNIALL